MARKDETLPLGPEAQPTRSTPELVFQLALYHRDGVETVTLAGDRAVVVGRAAPADLVVDDPSLSRQHARFSIADGVPTVEDLDSTNGTRVGGEQVERAGLAAGAEIVLGSVRCVVNPTRLRATSVLGTSVLGIVGHDTFVVLARQAVAQARWYQEPTAVLMVAVHDGDGATHVSRWASALVRASRPVDTVSIYAPTTLAVVLPRSGQDEVQRYAAALSSELAPVGAPRIGAALFPHDGSDSEALIEAAARAGRATTSTHPLRLGREAPAEAPDEPLIAVSASMRALRRDAGRAARAKLPVLLVGETGTGKEVLARAIHDLGPRDEAPLVATNCGAIPSQLVESTLFGHVRGAFTGADRDTPGVFGRADGGTVLLDEIGELPAAAQAALLRVLETGRLTPVGAAEERRVDVRVIAATHRDLEAMVAEGRFREDLLYRINALVLTVPPLRDRREDIAPLAARFVTRANAVVGDTPARTIGPEALAALERYRWPGNIRELRNVIDRACVMARGSTIELEDLPERVRSGVGTSGDARDDEAPDGSRDLRDHLRDVEAKLIRQALDAVDGNVAEAAERLNLPRRTLAHKIKTLGIGRD